MINPFLIRVILWNDKKKKKKKNNIYKATEVKITVWGLGSLVSEFEKMSHLGPFPPLKVSSKSTELTHSFVHQFVQHDHLFAQGCNIEGAGTEFRPTWVLSSGPRISCCRTWSKSTPTNFCFLTCKQTYSWPPPQFAVKSKEHTIFMYMVDAQWVLFL